MDQRTRRQFVRSAALGAAALSAPRGFAEALTLTPNQTEGPFYPDRMPLDTDNDLLLIGDATDLATGEVTHLGGKVLDASGEPIRDALVEIWQVDGKGVYLHSRSAGERRDANFQGYGRFTTGPTGEYYFRTVKPVLYPGRQAPHIHYAISRNGKRLLTTQCYIAGEEGNERDGVLRRIRDKAQRESVIVEFKPLENAKSKELEATFDIALGLTPEQE